MSYTDPCRGNCGANHWTDCEPSCSSRQPVIYTEEDKERWRLEKIKKEEGKKICDAKGHDWEYTFIIYQCKRCGETTDY